MTSSITMTSYPQQTRESVKDVRFTDV